MVTAEDLQDWMDENEEDILLDGPYDFNTAQLIEFGKVFYKKMNAKHGTNYIPSSDWIYDLPEDWSVYQGDEGNYGDCHHRGIIHRHSNRQSIWSGIRRNLSPVQPRRTMVRCCHQSH